MENHTQKDWVSLLLNKGNNILQEDPLAMQVSFSGRTRPHTIDTRWIYNRLFLTNDIVITQINSKKEIDPLAVREKLLAEGWQDICSEQYHSIDENKTKPTSIVLAHKSGFVINEMFDWRSQEENVKNRWENLSIDDIVEQSGEIPYLHNFSLYHGFQTGDYWNKDVYDKTIEIINSSTHDRVSGAAIGIISADSGGYYVKNFSLESKTPKFDFPDLHYGNGFQDFHNKLIKRLNEITKGLVLFHGDPGTGKTQYIRTLLRDLSQINKSILYAPPSLSGSLTEPQMIEFISDWVLGESRDCILLIEDAEPLLEVRHNGDGRSTGISNLLNMTDGLLNDILGLTVICTFNTQLSKIDPALLRAQRLVARKEFKKLPQEQFVKLSEALGIELPNIKYPATLAEFYAVKSNNEVLTHELDVEDKKIGFR
jgi:hypothetical protein